MAGQEYHAQWNGVLPGGCALNHDAAAEQHALVGPCARRSGRRVSARSLRATQHRRHRDGGSRAPVTARTRLQPREGGGCPRRLGRRRRRRLLRERRELLRLHVALRRNHVRDAGHGADDRLDLRLPGRRARAVLSDEGVSGASPATSHSASLFPERKPASDGCRLQAVCRNVSGRVASRGKSKRRPAQACADAPWKRRVQLPCARETLDGQLVLLRKSAPRERRRHNSARLHVWSLLTACTQAPTGVALPTHLQIPVHHRSVKVEVRVDLQTGDRR